MFFSSKLKKFKNIKHGFFSRNDGVSKGLYQSLNCGLGSKDKNENVIKNLEIVSKKIGCERNYLITLNQTHSNKVIYFENKSDVKNRVNADAIVCSVKNIGIGILTADCAPLIFYDVKNKIIGCVHSGWKGALNGIIGNTIKKFNELGSNANNMIAVVGPCIAKQSYEVEEDFLEKFIFKEKKNKSFFKKINNKKFFFDLRGFINKEIFRHNINNIENIEKDTFSEVKSFYSYRRSCLNKERDYGRCISVILMT